MRISTVVAVVSCSIGPLLSGCATYEESIWPAAPTQKWLFYQPEPMASADEAIGTIKNLQQNFVEWNGGFPLTGLDVDPYGLRAKWEWTEVTEQTNYVPSYGGFFVGSSYVPVYSGSYQTQTYSSGKSDMLVIPFDGVESLTLLHMPDLDRSFKYGLVVGLGEKEIPLRLEDEKSQRRLANAIFTLAAARGEECKVVSVGLGCSDLTPEQRETLSLPGETGLLVTRIAAGSPAEKAGIQFLDVLLEANGQPLKTGGGMAPILQAVEQAREKPISVKLLRRQKVAQPITNQSGKVVGQQEVEEKVERTVEITV